MTVIRSKDRALEILGLTPDAQPDEIRSAIKRLQQQNHPDKPGADTELFYSVPSIKNLLLPKQCELCGGTGTIKTKIGRMHNVQKCQSCC